MAIVQLAGSAVWLDYSIGLGRTLGIISFFERSQVLVRSFGAGLSVCNDVWQLNGHKYDLKNQEYEVYMAPVIYGKEKFYHGLAINRNFGSKLMAITEETREMQVYHFLMQNYSLPLLKEWAPVLCEALHGNGYMKEGAVLTAPYENERELTVPIGGRDVRLREVRMASIHIREQQLKELVSKLIRSQAIQVTKKPQRPLDFKDMDSYFKRYGQTLIANLEKQITPLLPLDGNAGNFTLKSKRLYPQQIAQVHAGVALLEAGSYYIMNHGMGTGKTATSAAVCESYAVKKWLQKNPKAGLEDAYEKEGVICYRNIIMCPGHMVKKWEAEILQEVAYAKVHVISRFSQLTDLHMQGPERRAKEFYIISKDFCKLSFQSIPVPEKQREKRVFVKKCASCSAVISSPGRSCPRCGHRSYRLVATPYKEEGMVCPSCNQLLFSYQSHFFTMQDERTPLRPMDFSVHNKKNDKCFYCGEELWKPFVSNIGSYKKPAWVRATFYANKAKKGEKTVWVHRDYMDEYCAGVAGQQPLSVIDTRVHQGIRKFSPALFIKKKLKGFFDIAIFDEAQDFKGGFTGQGHAMHVLSNVCRKSILLTGTISGGKANHLFYTLFRLDPARMRKMGYQYKDELKFSRTYGKVEAVFEYTAADDKTYRECCKGAQIGEPRIRPGISPLLFTDFLLDRTTYLDLSDMSKYLPALKEQVVSVMPETKEEARMVSEYHSIIDALRKKRRDKGGHALLSAMLQFSLSYLDHPYNVPPILSPYDGSIISEPGSYDQFGDVTSYDALSAKERKLVDLVCSEQADGRNVIIYAEYTASADTCVTYRLKAVIEKFCNLEGKVTVLESSSTTAVKREEWMHEQAAWGTKVFITNPRCVATGLDFCFTENGVFYNYPTLVFFQIGYSLLVAWQASRRAHRLNQTEECRVYYMAWRQSAQEAAIYLIAEKMAATSAIQGKFSVEGLSAMANGADSRLQLAAALADMDRFSGDKLQEMFDVLSHDDDNGAYEGYKPMLLFRELVGMEDTMDAPGSIRAGQPDITDLLETFMITPGEETPAADTAAGTVTAGPLVKVTLSILVAEKKTKKRVAEGQFSLAELF